MMHISGREPLRLLKKKPRRRQERAGRPSICLTRAPAFAIGAARRRRNGVRPAGRSRDLCQVAQVDKARMNFSSAGRARTR